MPRTPTDYSKTVIYKIQHKEKPELLYIGHTTNLKKRYYAHKSSSQSSIFKLYCLIRENGGFDMFEMTQIKDFSCLSKAEALEEEERIIKEYNSTMNGVKASRSDEDDIAYRKEYYKENKEYISTRWKEYKLENQDKIREQRAKYREENREQIREKDRQRRKDNPEKYKEKDRMAWAKRKDNSQEH